MELEDVFRANQGAVYAYLLRMLGDAWEAEELTQETFYRACAGAFRFRGESSVRTWLFGIARRVLLESLRARGELSPHHAFPMSRSTRAAMTIASISSEPSPGSGSRTGKC